MHKYSFTIVIACALTLSACDQIDYASVVSSKFKGSEISGGEAQDKFYVRKKDGSVWLIRARQKDTQEVQLFPAKD